MLGKFLVKWVLQRISAFWKVLHGTHSDIETLHRSSKSSKGHHVQGLDRSSEIEFKLVLGTNLGKVFLKGSSRVKSKCSELLE